MDDKIEYGFLSNKLIFCYLLYAITICLNDYFIYFFHLEYAVSLIVSGILVILTGVLYLRKNRLKWEKISVNKVDIVFGLMIITECIIRAIMPDKCYDTVNYHLYYQKFFDRDFINFDFFPMRSFNAQTFGAIGDRLYYGFRYVLGYRMGTLLNTSLIVLIYFQIKHIFMLIWAEFGHGVRNEHDEILVSIGTFVCMMTETTYANLSTYMIDYLAVPFLLEIFRVILCCCDEEEKISAVHTAGYLCVMGGFAVGIKITNVLIIFPLAIFFLIKQRKTINVQNILCSSLIFLFPLALYLVISYRITGNPVFPYLNHVFQSPYFSVEQSPNDFSAFNRRFGPKKFVEYMLWPFYMLRFPERTSDIAVCSGRLLILFVSFIIAVPYEFKNFTSKMKCVVIYVVYCYVLFLSILHGYMRYIPILEILGGAILFTILVEWIYHRSKRLKILGIVVSVSLLCQISVATGNYLLKNCEWSWRSIYDIPRMRANLPYVFHDHDTGESVSCELLNDIQCFVVPGASGSLAVELKEDVPVIGINPYFSTTNVYSTQLLEQRLQDIAQLNIYSLPHMGSWLDSLEVINGRGLAVEDIIPIQPDFWDKIYCLPLMKLKPVNEVDNISCESFASSEEVFTIDLAEDVDQIDIFIGDMITERKNVDNEYRVSVIGKNLLTGEEHAILQEAVISQTGRYWKESVNLSDDVIDQIEIRKISEDDKDILETFQIVLQEYR